LPWDRPSTADTFRIYPERILSGIDFVTISTGECSGKAAGGGLSPAFCNLHYSSERK